MDLREQVTRNATEIEFAKMEGLGNDFVVLDGRHGAPALDREQLQRLADRRHGIGFDQLLVLDNGSPGAAFGMTIFNADGSPAEQCGNGVRCLARYVARRGLTAERKFVIASSGRLIEVELSADEVRCNMGAPRFAPAEIPFQADVARAWYELELGTERLRIAAVSMGNPHAVLKVADVARAEVSRIGPAVERHVRFPRRVNVGFMQVLGRQEIRLRVFERGVGETRACGTGACAAAVIGCRNGLLNEPVRVHLPGGALEVSWQGGETPVWLTGPATWVYEGKIEV